MKWVLGGFITLYIIYVIAFILFQQQFILRPKQLERDYTFSTDRPFEELFIQTADGETLHALHLLPDSTKGIVLYFHGNWHNLENYLPYTKKFTDQGLSVLIPDYRGFGKSTGHLTETTFFSDTEYFYDYARKRFPEEKIFIYGRSLGTSAATWLAAKKKCRGLILETPFYNMYDVARRYGVLIPDGNFLPFGLRTDEYIRKVAAPILILHGTKDETISIRSARKLKPLLKPGDQFIEIKGGKHRTLDRFEEYHDAVDSLLKGMD